MLIFGGVFAKVSVWQGFRMGLRPLFSASSGFECSPGEFSKEESFGEHTEYLPSNHLTPSLSLTLRRMWTFFKETGRSETFHQGEDP